MRSKGKQNMTYEERDRKNGLGIWRGRDTLTGTQRTKGVHIWEGLDKIRSETYRLTDTQTE